MARAFVYVKNLYILVKFLSVLEGCRVTRTDFRTAASPAESLGAETMASRRGSPDTRCAVGIGEESGPERRSRPPATF